MRNAHRTAQPALTAKQPQTRAAWLHAAVTAPVHTPHRVVFLSKGESQPMESTVAVGRGRQPHTAQGWVEHCPAGGLLLSTRICAERSSEHHTQLKYPPQSDEQRGCVTKGKRSIQKNQSSLIGNVILNALAVPTLLSPRASAHLPPPKQPQHSPPAAFSQKLHGFTSMGLEGRMGRMLCGILLPFSTLSRSRAVIAHFEAGTKEADPPEFGC